MTPTDRLWHQQKTYEKIIIRRYRKASDCGFGRQERRDSPTHIREITDQQIIGDLLSLLDAIPTDGGMMKSFIAEVSLTQIYLCHGDDYEAISIYEGHLKTPSTGFLYEEAAFVLEKQFIDSINTLLDGRE